ncbi:MAG: LysR substrate-binding domain-containing protein [Pseudomonadota bacterium]
MQPSVDIVSRKIRLRQLRCFVTVVRMKGFMQAAQTMGLTQPAVSRSIRELEQILGHPLFDRSMRGAELTKRGAAFFTAAEASLSQIQLGTRAVLDAGLRSESVRIGALPNVCSRFLPPLIAKFKNATPEVRVTISPGTNAALLDMLRRAETDLVIGRLSSSDAMRGLVFEALYDEPLVFVASANHPLAHGSPEVTDAAGYPFVLPPEGTIIRQEIDRFFARHNVSQLPDLIETISSEFQRAHIASTDAIAIIPRGVIQDELDAGSLVDLRLDDGEMSGPVGLTLNPDLALGPAANRLLEQIRMTNTHI